MMPFANRLFFCSLPSIMHGVDGGRTGGFIDTVALLTGWRWLIALVFRIIPHFATFASSNFLDQ